MHLNEFAHQLEDSVYICDPFLEEMHFQAHQHCFDTTWDLTPPESPARLDENANFDSHITINLEHRDFSPCHDFSLWNHTGSAFEVRGDWTAPPSPVAFDDLSDVCSEIDSYPSFVLEGELLTGKCASEIPVFKEPLRVTSKRKLASSTLLAPPPTKICKAKSTPVLSKAAIARQRPARRIEVSPTPSEVESDDPESKRHTHNVLERKRRNELKSSYQELREEIPDLYDNDKTPTGVILNRACEYIAILQEEEALLLKGLALAKIENAKWRKMLA